jgi:hypothetical protein
LNRAERRNQLHATIEIRISLLGLLLAFSASAMAEESGDEHDPGASEENATAQSQRRGFSTRESKTGVERDKPPFGGPTSPQGEIVETDLLREPAFRFPAADEAFKPWNAWKAKQSKDHGFDLSAHYSTMYQGLSDSITGRDAASAGVLRFTGKWTLVGRGTKDTGSLVVTLDHRHAFRGDGPQNLAGDAGYIGATGLFYNDMGAAIINLNWQQGFNDGNTGLIAGRYDPNDYMNALGYVNPWTIFSNLAINLDTRHQRRKRRRLRQPRVFRRRRGVLQVRPHRLVAHQGRALLQEYPHHGLARGLEGRSRHSLGERHNDGRELDVRRSLDAVRTARILGRRCADLQ